MTTVISAARNIGSVIQWLLHPAYNYDVATLVAPAGGIAAGTNLKGKLAIDNGDGTWTQVIAATVVAADTKLGVILRDELVLTAVAAAGTIAKTKILARGPALVHDDELDYTEHTAATVKAALLAQGIRVVDETGDAYTPEQ